MTRDTVIALAVGVAGPVIWFAHFSAMYGIETLLCLGPASAESQAGFRIVGGALTVVALAGLAGLVWHMSSGPRTFLWQMSRALSALSALAVLWTALPIVLLPACVPASPI